MRAVVFAFVALVACERRQASDDLPRPTEPDVVRKFPLKRVAPTDSTVDEEWSRDIAGPELMSVHGVDAVKSRSGLWRWHVVVSVMEFIRDVPLEDELRKRIPAALRAVKNVTEVREEDREVWVVGGDVTGPELVDAVSGVVDALATQTRAEMDRDRP